MPALTTRFARSAASLALMLPLLAQAGGTAVVESGSGAEAVRSTLEFDGTKLRVTSTLPKGAEQVDAYMIFRDGKPYSVVNNEGTPMVMEMSAMMKMMGSMAQHQTGGTNAFDDVTVYHGLTDTGRAETVGGVRGKVYRLDFETQSGQRQSSEVVLASNVVLREFTTAMMAFGTAMTEASGIGDAEGGKQLQAELARRNLGVLRAGDDFRIVSLDDKTPAQGRFVLPAAPMQMPEMPGGFALPGMGGSAQGGVGVGGTIGGKIERQRERIEARSEGEADAATDRAVDKVLDKAFGKIFGGE